MAPSVSMEFGSIKFELSGSEEFLEKHVPLFLTRLDRVGSAPEAGKPSESGVLEIVPNQPRKLTVGNIAGLLKCNSGQELILAACLRITRDGQGTIKRSEILSEMRQATGYFKEGYRKHLSGFLQALIRSRKLLEVAPDTYSVPGETLDQMHSRIA